MDPEPNKGTGTRRIKYAPKAPPRRAPTKPEVKSEAVENVDAAQAMDLLQRFNENQVAWKSRAKDEKKVAPSQVAFGGTSSRNYGFFKKSSSAIKQGRPHSSGLRNEEEYKEPWDFYSDYPLVHPLRRPYSGNPERLNEEEFGENSETMNFDENATSSAEKLGLMEDDLEPKMFFVQLPPTLPMQKSSAKADGQAAPESSRAPGGSRATTQKASNLKELPAGSMGKLQIYQSGAVKLKLGDTLYDVNPGMDCSFAQDVVAVNTAQKQFCVVGELEKRAVITPDVDSLLNSIMDM